MRQKAITTAKQVFESDNVIITNVLQGDGFVRIDARTRHHVSDKDNFFSKWISTNYANRLSLENYGKKVFELNVFRY